MDNTNTFAGLPACRDLDGLTADIDIIGIHHGTSYYPGKPSHSAQSPLVIRKATGKYASMLDHYDFDLGGPLLDNGKIRVVDCGDVPGDLYDAAGNRKLARDKIRSVNSPVTGGLSYRQVVDLIHGLAAKTDVRGFDLVEFYPDKDNSGLGALTAARIVFHMIGAVVRYAALV